METITNRVDRDIHFKFQGFKREYLMQLSSTCSCEKWNFECIAHEPNYSKSDNEDIVRSDMGHLFPTMQNSRFPILKNAVYQLYYREYSIVFPEKNHLVREIWARWDTARFGSRIKQWDGQISTLDNGRHILWLLKQIRKSFQQIGLRIDQFYRSDGSVII